MSESRVRVSLTLDSYTYQDFMPNQPQDIQVKITDDVLKGVYANNVSIMLGKEEFVLDFMTMTPPQGIVSARVYVNPSHAKRLAKVLQENVKKYEDQFGVIPEGAQNTSEIGFKTE